MGNVIRAGIPISVAALSLLFTGGSLLREGVIPAAQAAPTQVHATRSPATPEQVERSTIDALAAIASAPDAQREVWTAAAVLAAFDAGGLDAAEPAVLAMASAPQRVAMWTRLARRAIDRGQTEQARRVLDVCNPDLHLLDPEHRRSAGRNLAEVQSLVLCGEQAVDRIARVFDPDPRARTLATELVLETLARHGRLDAFESIVYEMPGGRAGELPTRVGLLWAGAVMQEHAIDRAIAILDRTRGIETADLSSLPTSIRGPVERVIRERDRQRTLLYARRDEGTQRAAAGSPGPTPPSERNRPALDWTRALAALDANEQEAAASMADELDLDAEGELIRIAILLHRATPARMRGAVVEHRDLLGQALERWLDLDARSWPTQAGPSRELASTVTRRLVFELFDAGWIDDATELLASLSGSPQSWWYPVYVESLATLGLTGPAQAAAGDRPASTLAVLERIAAIGTGASVDWSEVFRRAECLAPTAN